MALDATARGRSFHRAISSSIGEPIFFRPLARRQPFLSVSELVLGVCIYIMKNNRPIMRATFETHIDAGWLSGEIF